MKLAEYQVMSEVEDTHWWYVGLRDLLSRILNRLDWPSSDLAMLDAGCGTGANLRLLQQQLNPSYLSGFDFSPLAVERAQQKAPDAELYESDLCQPEFPRVDFDLILSCEVLNATGIDAARAGMRRVADALRPGGWLVMNLAAYDWLRSEHDVAVHNVQRFTRRQIRDFVESLGLDCRLISYRLSPLLPAIVMARLPSMLRRPAVQIARSDLRVPAAPINNVLKQVVFAENAMIERGFRMPCGSSIICAAQRPTH